MRFFGKRQQPPITPPPAPMIPIGVVRNAVDQHRADGWERIESEIVVRDDLAPGLVGLEGFGRVTVVFWLDRVPDEGRSILRLRPGGLPDMPEVGVFATRTHNRPNPLAVTTVELLHIEGAVVRVRGLDALNGSPVLDLRPYLPPYDAFPDATMPPWVWGPR